MVVKTFNIYERMRAVKVIVTIRTKDCSNMSKLITIIIIPW